VCPSTSSHANHTPPRSQRTHHARLIFCAVQVDQRPGAARLDVGGHGGPLGGQGGTVACLLPTLALARCPVLAVQPGALNGGGPAAHGKGRKGTPLSAQLSTRCAGLVDTLRLPTEDSSGSFEDPRRAPARAWRHSWASHLLFNRFPGRMAQRFVSALLLLSVAKTARGSVVASSPSSCPPFTSAGGTALTTAQAQSIQSSSSYYTLYANCSVALVAGQYFIAGTG